MKLNAQIAAAYWGCMVSVNGMPHKVTGIKESVIGTFYQSDMYSSWCSFDNCQLILTPLSEISDKHAIEVASIINAMHPHSEALKFDASLVKMGYKVEANRSSSLWNFDVIDYLRSKGYDCGYDSIPSLIEAGIAINNQ